PVQDRRRLRHRRPGARGRRQRRQVPRRHRGEQEGHLHPHRRSVEGVEGRVREAAAEGGGKELSQKPETKPPGDPPIFRGFFFRGGGPGGRNGDAPPCPSGGRRSPRTPCRPSGLLPGASATGCERDTRPFPPWTRGVNRPTSS